MRGTGKTEEPSDSASLRLYDSANEAPAPMATVADAASGLRAVSSVPPAVAAPAPSAASAVPPSVPTTEVLPAALPPGSRPALPVSAPVPAAVGDVLRRPPSALPAGPAGSEADDGRRRLVMALVVGLVVVLAATVALAWYFGTRRSAAPREVATGTGGGDEPTAGAGTLSGVVGPVPVSAVPAAGAEPSGGTDPAPSAVAAAAIPQDDRAMYVAATARLGCAMVEFQSKFGRVSAGDEQVSLVSTALSAFGIDRAVRRAGRPLGLMVDVGAAVNEATEACVALYYGEATEPGSRTPDEERDLYLTISAEVSCEFTRRVGEGRPMPVGIESMELVAQLAAAHGVRLVQFSRWATTYGKEPGMAAGMTERMSACLVAAQAGGAGPMDEATARETYIGALSDVACLGPPRTEAERAAGQLERACAAHGITLQQFAALAQQFGDDPAAQRESAGGPRPVWRRAFGRSGRPPPTVWCIRRSLFGEIGGPMHDAPSKSGSKLLPDSAYRKLREGETYEPIVPASDKRAEVTVWSVSLGLIMVVVFSAACVYMALRAGNAIEASIPIAILAIFFGRLKAVKSTILENVMVQSIGQASGVVAAGATFVIPALYINQQSVSWWQILLACTVGGFLGIVLIIPLRKYFVKEMHGELPFPEATAINEILVAGESTAGGAGKILLFSFALGAAFDFLVEGVHLWNAEISSTAVMGDAGQWLVGHGFQLQIAGLAALFGLGYIIGIKYASIIASGSVLAVLVIVPVIKLLGAGNSAFAYAGNTYDIGAMSPGAVFGAFVKPIGIGAIAVAGLISILRMGKIVAGSVSLGFKGLSKQGGDEAAPERTQWDVQPTTVLLAEVGLLLAMGLIFFIVAWVTPQEGGIPYTMGECLIFAVVGMVVGFLLSFLFTPVAAQAIAIVGVNPVSGMTLITVVLSIVAMILTGLSGSAGMVIALIIGTAVCTALSTSGALITDFKIGYWIGSTPRNQQVWKFLGVVVAALVIAFVVPPMDQAYHFLVQDPATGQMVSNDKVLPAPQANMLAAVSKGLMSDPANQPWLLYGIGGLVAVLLFMAGVPMLAFALGMYLPLSINLAVLAGAAVAWIISKTGRREEVKRMRAEQGTLIASGLMAGAAIIGLFTAVLRLPAVGAPIRFLSVGETYEFHPVVAGQDKSTSFLCRDLKLAPGQSCETRWVVDEPAQTRPEVFVDGRPLRGLAPCSQLALGQNQSCREIMGGDEVTVARKDLVVDGKVRPPVASCDELKLVEGQPCEVRETKTWDGEAKLEILVDEAALPEVVPCEQLKLGKDQKCEIRTTEDRAARTHMQVLVDGVVRGPVTSCEELRLAEGSSCEVRQVESAKAKTHREVLVDGKLRAPLKSCDEVNVPEGRSCEEVLEGKAQHWYEGRDGQLLGLLALLGLALGCYHLARVGAKWALAATAAAKKAEAEGEKDEK